MAAQHTLLLYTLLVLGKPWHSGEVIFRGLPFRKLCMGLHR